MKKVPETGSSGPKCQFSSCLNILLLETPSPQIRLKGQHSQPPPTSSHSEAPSYNGQRIAEEEEEEEATHVIK